MNIDARDVLVIPPDGLMELFHTEQEFDPDYYTRVLIDHQKGQGDPALVEVTHDGQEFRVGALINNPPDEKVNTRAREACAEFFGWHMVFVGPMFIAGLTAEQARQIIERLS